MKILNCRFTLSGPIKKSILDAQNHFNIEKHAYAAKPAIIKILSSFSEMLSELKKLREENALLKNKT